MQSCPKNGLTGPLTGDSKRSNLSSISKDSMPLPPVALALPLEPNSVTGPPSPARGSAGMPPPPSPAGATYQPPPPPTKQESHSPGSPDGCKIEKKRKARVGKAMVRNHIAAGMQQTSMLLMCNPQNYVSAVKREIESPKEKENPGDKTEQCSSDEDTKPIKEMMPVSIPKTEEEIEVSACQETQEEQCVSENNEEEDEQTSMALPEPLPPVVSTVAENVKVKNMKRKISLTNETKETESDSGKKQKIGSYKCLIKKETNCIKINNGKRKLIEDPLLSDEVEQDAPVTKSKKPTTKRKLSATKEEPSKRLKITKTLTDNTHNSKQRSKSKENGTIEPSKNDDSKKAFKKQLINSKTASTKSAPVVLDNLFAKNSIDRTIESVVKENCLRTSPLRETDASKPSIKCVKSVKESVLNKKIIIVNKCVPNKVKSECKKIDKNRKSKSTEVAMPQPIAKAPRRASHTPRWSNGWRWEGEPYQSKVFINVSSVY